MPADPANRSPRTRFSVVSYNIHQCVGRDRRRDPRRIAEVIKESGADIVGLQEVHSDASGEEELHQMNYLAASMGYRAVGGSSLERNNGEYGNVLLTRGNVLDVRKLDLSLPRREPRGAIDADVEIGGETVRVIVTHLGLNRSERKSQVQRLLGALSGQRMERVILLGDINEWMPACRCVRWLEARLCKAPRLRTFPSRFPVLPLDGIWVSRPLSFIDLKIVNTPLARIASDHLPVKATVENSAASGDSEPGFDDCEK